MKTQKFCVGTQRQQNWAKSLSNKKKKKIEIKVFVDLSSSRIL